MDERMKFVRGNPFDGLGDYENSSSLRTKRQSIYYPVQGSLFCESELSSKDTGYGLRQKLGHFYELISQGINGGKVKKQFGLSNKNQNFYESIKSEPDIIQKNNIVREVKSVAPGQALKLLDCQIAKYVLLQMQTEGHFKDKVDIRFDVFRHGTRKLQSTYCDKPLNDFVENLSKTTKYLISMPFSLIFDIYLCGDNDITSRYDGDKYTTLTRLGSRGMNQFIAYPKETIEHVGANPDEYSIEKRKFPKTVSVNGTEVSSFPILIIREKNGLDLSKKLEEIIHDDKIISKRFHESTHGLVGENNESKLMKEQADSLFGPEIPLEDVPF